MTTGAATPAELAKQAALDALARRPHSRHELRTKLVRKGHDAQDIEHALDVAERLGLIDDEQYAQEVARIELSRKPAGRSFLESKLRSKGVPAEIAARTARDATEPRDELSDAVSLIERTASSSSLEPHVLRRRLGARLARRGFSPDVCRRAVERVLGQDELP